MPDLPIYASTLLSLLASAGFAADDDRAVRARASIVLGFAAGLAVTQGVGMPGAGVLGLLVSAVAAARLFWPMPRWMLPCIAGVLAGFCAAAYHSQSVPWAAAVPVLAAPLISAALVRRPNFVTASLQEEALVMLLLLGLVLAAMPEVAAGWRSAATLTLTGPVRGAPHGVAWWAVLYVAMAAALGGLRSLWRRR